MNQLEKSIQLSYRPMIRRLYWAAFIGLILSEMIIIRLNLPKLMSESIFAAGVQLVLASTVVLSLFFRLFVFVRPRIFSEYFVEGALLKIIRGKKVKELDLSSVSQVRFSLLPPRYFGGYKLHFKSGQVFYFLSLLEGNYKVLERALHLNPDLLTVDKQRQYLKTAMSVESSWGRMYRKLKNIKLVALKYIALPLFGGVTYYASVTPFWNKSLSTGNHLINWFSLHLLLVMVVTWLTSMIEENWIQGTCQLDGDGAVQRNFEKEKSIEMSVFIGGFLLILILQIAGIVLFRD